jgi:hypothetical protein
MYSFIIKTGSALNNMKNNINWEKCNVHGCPAAAASTTPGWMLSV